MQRNKRIILGLAIIGLTCLFGGCIPQRIDNVRPDNIFVPTEVKPQTAAGSIWQGESDKSLLFVGKKARYINDIVTIIISETAVGENKAATATSRDSSTSAAITSLLGLENSIIKANANMGGTIGLGGTSSNSLKGSGDTSRNGTLTAIISARVIRVLDNGNLLIEGRRQITVNAEDQFIIITGIIRLQDITSDNTIQSQYVADARIIYTGDGVANDKMRPGWLTRVVDWVWPF
jgi:flagellar L-ring protein precursor FlgH